MADGEVGGRGVQDDKLAWGIDDIDRSDRGERHGGGRFRFVLRPPEKKHLLDAFAFLGGILGGILGVVLSLREFFLFRFLFGGLSEESFFFF